MKSSDTHAAKRPHMNKKLAKMFGTPDDVSDGTGGRTTMAAKRPETNSTIAGKYFFEGPNNWGHGVS
jgi:hypothetical protein